MSTVSVTTVVASTPVRLVDYAKAYLVVVPVGDVGGLIARGALSIDGRPAAIAEPVHAGAVIAVDDAAIAPHALRPQPIPLVVRYEDDALLVCDKPAGMHVHPLGSHREDTLLNALLWHCGARSDQPWGRWRPHPLHRLDRAASGLIAIAKHAAVHDDVRRQFAEHSIERRYLAVVHGRVASATGTIASPLGRDPACDYRRAVVPVEQGGQPAVTHFTPLECAGDRTLLELVLETGRTHQIRAHLASIGHPIVGDSLYAPGGERRDAASAILLHAKELRLRHPRRDTIIACTAPPPDHFWGPERQAAYDKQAEDIARGFLEAYMEYDTPDVAARREAEEREKEREDVAALESFYIKTGQIEDGLTREEGIRRMLRYFAGRIEREAPDIGPVTIDQPLPELSKLELGAAPDGKRYLIIQQTKGHGRKVSEQLETGTNDQLVAWLRAPETVARVIAAMRTLAERP